MLYTAIADSWTVDSNQLVAHRVPKNGNPADKRVVELYALIAQGYEHLESVEDATDATSHVAILRKPLPRIIVERG